MIDYISEDENENTTNEYIDDQRNEELNIEMIEDDILHFIIEMKQSMLEYVNHEKKPLLEFFDFQIWRDVTNKCLKILK